MARFDIAKWANEHRSEMKVLRGKDHPRFGKKNPRWAEYCKAQKGKKSPETSERNRLRARLGLYRKGKDHPLYGRKLPAHILAILKDRENSKNPNWKGNKGGYDAIHDWVKRRFPKPDDCNRCGKKGVWLDLSNNLGKKYERKIENYEYICRKCHRLKDGLTKKKVG